MATLNEITSRAEEIGVTLIKNGFESDDPDLAPLCTKLKRFRPLLEGKNTDDEQQVRQLLQSGFALVTYTPGDDDLKTESIQFLGILSDKLAGFASTGSFLKGLF